MYIVSYSAMHPLLAAQLSFSNCDQTNKASSLKQLRYSVKSQSECIVRFPKGIYFQRDWNKLVPIYL